MVDTVNTEVLFSGGNKYIVRFTNLSDGTGETNVVKVDRSELIGPDGVAPGKIVIEEIQYDVQGFDGVVLEWHLAATPDEPLAILNGQGIKEYKRFGGLVPDTVGATVDGDIKFTTNGTEAAGDTYDILLVCRLKA